MPETSCEDRNHATVILGIAGGSAGGKTTFSRQLQVHAGAGAVTVLQLDRFYRPQDEPPLAGTTANFDRPQAIDLELAETVVAELKQLGRASVPIYDFVTHQRVGFEPIESAPLVIVEGIFALWHRPLRDMLDLGVFVDTPHDERLARRIQRDCEQRGRDTESVKRQWFETVLPMHDLFVEPTKTHADRIVDGRSDLQQAAIALLREFQFGLD